jgi:hypothetical protein
VNQSASSPGKRVRDLDPMKLLSLADLASAMGVSQAELKQARNQGRVFSVRLSCKGEDVVGFPAFAALVSDEAMIAIVSALRSTIGRDLYLFLFGVNQMLGGLAPAELVLRRKFSERPISRVGWSLLRMREAARM